MLEPAYHGDADNLNAGVTEKSPQFHHSVLLIEDNPRFAQEMQELLQGAGYKVSTAQNAKQAFSLIFRSPADLIILDINLQDLDGFHVAKELKRNMMFRHIPVILLSSRSDFLEKMKTFDVIVDEYLVKPIDHQELLLRSKLVLQRVQSSLDANPLTRLPGNIEIVKTLKRKIAEGKPYAVGYADLNNFKAFNDKYGFSHGDQVIKLAAKIIVAAVQRFSAKDNFVGHVGGDDFIFVCSYDHANEICQWIAETFDREVLKSYTEEDRKKGYIVVEDRRGVVSQFPVVSIAIGLASDEGGKFTNLGQVNHSLTQLKKYAKSFQGSAYVRDRRTMAAKLAEFTWGPGSSVAEPNLLENITKALGAVMPDKLKEIMEKRAITVLFQPIIDMRADEVMGHESLVRGPAGTPMEYPDALFQTARTANRVPELDVLCMKKILDCSNEFHPGIMLFINMFPETLLEENLLESEILSHPRFKELDVIFELSGSQRASDATDLFATLRRFKEKGAKVCVDASLAMAGQGLRLLPDLRPHYMKLNMMNFQDMANDHTKQEEFLKVINVIRQVGSEVICTKLESRADSYLALRFGVTYGQGFLFARPASAKSHTIVH